MRLDVLQNKITTTNIMAKIADYTITGKSGTKYTFGMYAYPGSWNSVILRVVLNHVFNGFRFSENLPFIFCL